MACNCKSNNHGCGCNKENNCDSVIKTEYNCNADRNVIKHQHVVKYRHDIINEYEVIHEHDYNYYDVVTNREVVKHHDNTSYKPNYCGENCGGGERSGNCGCKG